MPLGLGMATSSSHVQQADSTPFQIRAFEPLAHVLVIQYFCYDSRKFDMISC